MSNDFRFLMYQSAEENVSVNAVIKDETLWLSQKGIAVKKFRRASSLTHLTPPRNHPASDCFA